MGCGFRVQGCTSRKADARIYTPPQIVPSMLLQASFPRKSCGNTPDTGGDPFATRLLLIADLHSSATTTQTRPTIKSAGVSCRAYAITCTGTVSASGRSTRFPPSSSTYRSAGRPHPISRTAYSVRCCARYAASER